MTRIERITKMEALFDKSEVVVKRLEAALEDFAKLEHDIAKLETYYNSPQWRKDFEADEAGKLPKDLKRGVLSEDDTLLREILWNPYTVGQVENIQKQLTDLIDIIGKKDEKALQQYLTRIRKNIE